jgi:hypothetical protein
MNVQKEDETLIAAAFGNKTWKHLERRSDLRWVSY